MPSDDDSVSDDDLCQLEACADERFKAVGARFVAIDGRFIALGQRIDGIEIGLEELDRASERRCDEIDCRIDAAQSSLDNVRLALAAEIDQAYRDVQRSVVLGLLGTVVCAAMLCAGTILLAL